LYLVNLIPIWGDPVDARQNSSELNFAPTPATIDRMLELLIVIVRALTLALRGHRELVLETWRCGNNWRPSTERRDAASGHATDSFGWPSSEVGETGARR
jgi:hypothetical protein